MFTIFGLAKLWIAMLVLAILLLAPITVRLILLQVRKDRQKAPTTEQVNQPDKPLKSTPIKEESVVESIIPDQKIKFNRQETVTPEMRDAPEVKFLAPDYNDMSDDQVNTLMKEQGIKLGHTKQQRLVAKKQPKQVSEPLPDFESMDNEAIKSWVSNNASRITIKATK